MDNEKIGKFILELRKEANMTQKELAEQFNVTDKAISKWERGLGCPDISLLMTISSFFKIDVSELLNGKRGTVNQDETIHTVLEYADEKIEKKMAVIQNMRTICVTMLMMAIILISSIIDMISSKGFTWSCLSNSFITFTWFVLLPIIQYQKKGIVKSMMLFSLLIIPFIYLLHGLLYQSRLLLTVGIPSSLIVILLLWSIYFLFKKLNSRKFLLFVSTIVLVIFVQIFLNILLISVVGDSALEKWNIIVFISIIIITLTLCFISFLKKIIIIK